MIRTNHFSVLWYGRLYISEAGRRGGSNLWTWGKLWSRGVFDPVCLNES